MQLPNELMRIIMKKRWFNARKERLEKVLKFRIMKREAGESDAFFYWRWEKNYHSMSMLWEIGCMEDVMEHKLELCAHLHPDNVAAVISHTHTHFTGVTSNTVMRVADLPFYVREDELD